MTVNLYTCKSPNNYIGKTLENENTFDCVFKGIADIINPVIAINSAEFISANYAYIPTFGRYYFINNVQIQPNDYYILSMHVDVLESWKADILASTVKVQQDSVNNSYYATGLENQIKKSVVKYDSSITLPDTKTNILCTIGG